MRKTIIFLAIPLMFFSLAKLMPGFPQKGIWNKTEVIKDLPFCAFMLRTLESRRGREVHILMEPDKVTESNLLLLFKAVSERNPDLPLLEAFVSTDIQQLRSLVTNMNMSGTPRGEESERSQSEVAVTSSKSGTERNQWAYYKRTGQVELFRYNPTFPDVGMKTTILRGNE